MQLTYVDAGVLIAAARGNVEDSVRALRLLDQPGRSFASSEFVRLEVLPKALFHKKSDEAKFYEIYFEAVSRWADDSAMVIKQAHEVGAAYGLSAMDALHIAAALTVRADELVTTERLQKPIHRVKAIRVRSLYALGA